MQVEWWRAGAKLAFLAAICAVAACSPDSATAENPFDSSVASRPEPASDQVATTAVIDTSSALPEPTVRESSSSATAAERLGALTSSEVDAVLFTFGYFDWDNSAWDDYVAGLEQSNDAQQEFIRDCMALVGFEYFITIGGPTVWRPGYEVVRNTQVWSKLYGLGVSTTYFSQEALGQGATGHVGLPRPEPRISEASEETQYLNSLSPSAYRSYSLALSGIDPSTLEFNDSGELVSELDDDALESSCQLRALDANPEPLGPLDNSQEIGERILSSDLWRDYADAAWTCVRTEGYAVAGQLEAEDLVTEQALAVGLFSSEFDDIPANPSSLPVGFVELLAQVQAFELRLAEVMWDCNIHPIQERSLFLSQIGSYPNP